MTNEGENTRRRPVGVWVISGFYALAVPCLLLMLVVVLSGPVELRATAVKRFETLGMLEWFFTLAGVVVGVSAAVCLFLLRRVAVALFVVEFGLNLANSAYRALTTDWLETLGGTQVASMVLVWFTMAVVIAYTRGLAKSGVLK